MNETAVEMDTEQGAKAAPPGEENGRMRGMPIVFRNLGVKMENGKQTTHILKGATAAIPPGAMVCLMGPSGCGKTTLLDMLSLRKTSGEMEGELFTGGCRPSKSFISRVTAYCEQANSLIPELTVRDFLLYTANLKRPKEESREAKERAVDNLLDGLGLRECKTRRIGSDLFKGISGGQAKRLSVAAQLIVEPSILYLDEPTSGLDSYTAHETMEIVKRYCKRDRVTVVATIHSPSARTFAIFDTMLLLLAGRQIFYGPVATSEQKDSLVDHLRGCVRDAPSLARHDNVAEFVVDLTTSFYNANQWQPFVDAYESSELKARNEALVEMILLEYAQYNRNHKDFQKRSSSGNFVPSSRNVTSPASNDSSSSKAKQALEAIGASVSDFTSAEAFSEPWTFGKSYAGGTRTPVWWAILTMLRYRARANYMTMDFVMSRGTEKIVQGFVISTLYTSVGDTESGNKVLDTAAVLFMVIVLPAFGAASYIPSIAGEKRTFYREVDDGLISPLAYLIFKVLEESLLAVLCSFVFSSMVFFPLELRGNFGLFFLVHFTVLSMGIILAYAIAAATPNSTAANAALPLYCVVMLFFVGELLALAQKCSMFCFLKSFLARRVLAVRFVLGTKSECSHSIYHAISILFLDGTCRNLDNIPPGWRWFSFITPLRYAWLSLMLNQFDEGDELASGESVLDLYSVPDTSPWKMYGLLWAFYLFYFVAAWASLAFIRHQSR